MVNIQTISDNIRRMEVNGKFLACDTPLHTKFLEKSIIPNLKGRVLITGLGLGIAPMLAAQNPNVSSILVIEKSIEVVALNAGIVDEKISIFIGDAWRGDSLGIFNTAFHDIWSNINEPGIPLEELRMMKIWSNSVTRLQLTLPTRYKEFMEWHN